MENAERPRRKRLITITGDEEASKAVAAHLERRYGVPVLRPLTDQELAADEQEWYRKATPTSLDGVLVSDLLSYQERGRNAYYLLHGDVPEQAVYLVGEKDLRHLKSCHQDRYDLTTVYLKREDPDWLDQFTTYVRKLLRMRGKRRSGELAYDYVLNAHQGLETLLLKTDIMLQDPSFPATDKNL